MALVRTLGRRSALAGALALAGCQAPGATPVAASAAEPAVRLGPDRTGYITIVAPIVNPVRDAFIRQVNKLLAMDAAAVHVLLTSPGGVVTAAQDMIAFMDATHASRGTTFTTHNTGIVASAACYVFLAGQRRLCVPGGQFLFHEASMVSSGAISSLALQDAAIRMQQIERSFLAMLTARTRLTPAEASSFVRRTVILSADEARRDGVTQETVAFALPPGATVFNIRAVPRSAPTAPRPPGALPGG